MPAPILQANTNEAPILAVLPKFIGDAINTLPALALLRQLYPNSPLHLFVRPHLVSLLEHQHLENTVIIRDERKKPWDSFKHASGLKAESYQLAVLFRGSLSEAILCRLAGIKNVIGYAQNGRKPLLKYALKLNQNHHYIQRYCRIVNEAHGNPFSHFNKPTLQYHTSPFIEVGSDNIGCYFGGKNKGTRYYPTHLAAEAVEMMLSKTGCKVALLGDPSEYNDNQAIVDALEINRERVVNLAGKTSLPELVDVIGNLNALVTIDSGPMHMAAATDTPSVAIVGLGTSPWSIVAPKTPLCIPLVANGFTLSDSAIIEDITPTQIIQSLSVLLSSANV